MMSTTFLRARDFKVWGMKAHRPTRPGSAGRDGRDVLEHLARLLARQAATDQFRSAPGVTRQNASSPDFTTPRSATEDRPINDTTPLSLPQGKGASND